MVWSLFSKCREEIIPKALGYPKFAGRVFSCSDIHRVDERSIKKVQRAFVLIVVHIVNIHLKGPLNRFGSKSKFAIFLQEIIIGPLLVSWPFFHDVGQDERLIGPAVRKLKR